MKEYSVREVAELLSTNVETVRRWIRDGKLESSFSSNKTGHRITEDELNVFLNDNPKYRSAANKGLAVSIGSAIGCTALSMLFPLPAALGATMLATTAGVAIGAQAKNDDGYSEAMVADDQIIEFLTRAVADTEANIRKTTEILDSLQTQVVAYKGLLETYLKQLDIYITQLSLVKDITSTSSNSKNNGGNTNARNC